MSGSSETGASSFSLMPTTSGCAPFSASDSVAGTPAWARTSSSVIRSGSSRSLGPAGPVQASRDPLDEVVDAVAERVGPRRRRRCGAARRGSAACSTPGRGPAGLRHQRRDPAVDLGVQRVAEPQLEPAAEHVAHRGPEVRPPAGRGDDVQAEGEAAGGQLLDLQLEVVEVGAQRAPAVDDQEHVAVPVVGAALRPPRPVGLDRVDAVGAEVLLAPVHDARSPRRRSGSPRRARSGCRRRPRAAARSSRRRCRRRSRARRTATPAAWSSAPCWPRPTAASCSCRCADRRPRRRDRRPPDRSTDEGVAALLARPVHGAEGYDEAAERAPLLRHQAELRVRRRGPASARRGCPARRAAAARPGAPPGRGRPCGRPRCRAATAGRRLSTGVGSGSGSSTGTSSFSTSEIVNGRMPWSLPPSSRRTRTRPDGGPET